MNQITDFRIDTVEIGEAAFYSLPLRVRELLGAYATPLRSLRPDVIRFELPIYRWTEIEPLLDADSKWLKSSTDTRGKHDT